MNAGVWIGIIGGIIGLLVGVGAVVATAGPTGIYIGLGMLVLFGGMFYLFYRIFFKPMINASRLQKTGLPGKAKILEVRDTGVTINNHPQVKLILEVKNQFGQTYTTETRVLVSRINPGIYMAGMELPVKIDPKNTLATIKQEIESASQGMLPDKLLGYLQKMEQSIAEKGSLTVEGIRRSRTQIRDLMATENLRGSDIDRRLGLVLDSAADDLAAGLSKGFQVFFFSFLATLFVLLHSGRWRFYSRRV